MRRCAHAFSFLIAFLSLNAFAQVGAVVDVTMNPVGNFKAKTSDVKGEAVLFDDTVKADNIVVSLKNLKTGMDMRDKHAREKYLQVDKYPEIVLVHGEGTAGKGTGTVRLKGVEKPIAGTYEVKGSTVTAKFPLKLSAFGIEGIGYKGVGVEDEVKVEVTVPLKKSPLPQAKPLPKAPAKPAK